MNHSKTSEAVGHHHLVGPGAKELFFRGFLIRPAKDKKIGVHPSGRHGDEQIVRIGQNNRHKPFCSHDTGFYEHFLAGGIINNIRDFLLSQFFLGLRILVDDHQGNAVALQFLCNDDPDPPVPAQNVVVFNVLQFQPQFPPADKIPHLKFNHDLRDDPKGVGHNPHAGKYEENRKDPPRFGNRPDFAVSNGCDGDHRHVEGFKQRPSLNDHVACRSQKENQGQQDDAPDDTPKACTGNGIVATRLLVHG